MEADTQTPAAFILPTLHIPTLERWAVEQAVLANPNSKSKAATSLGISKKTLERRLKDYAAIDNLARTKTG